MKDLRSTGRGWMAGVLGMALLAAFCGAPPVAHADTAGAVKAALDTARSEAGCPPLEVDPKLTEIAHNTVNEVKGWVNHTGTVLPTEDATVMAALRQADYKTLKARMLSGYADDLTGGSGTYDDKVVKATVLQGLSFEVFGDCSYSKYGISVAGDDGSQGSPSTPPRSFLAATAIVASG